MRGHLGIAVVAAAAVTCLVGIAPAAAKPRYAEGQVWEYRTRVGDEGSLLKIQKIEKVPGLKRESPVYHITVVGVRLGGTPGSVLGHLPVSRQTLDSSLTRLSTRRADFPSAEEGIAEWRRAKGGVFTISVAEIVGFVEQTISGAQKE